MKNVFHPFVLCAITVILFSCGTTATYVWGNRCILAKKAAKPSPMLMVKNY